MLEEPVDSLAFSKPPKLGVRSGLNVRVFDGKRWKQLPTLPERLAGQTFELFFGRDNEPRILGFSLAANPAETKSDAPSKTTSIHLRFKGGSWQPEPSELGRLASPRGALYGVLGWDDPEVVCRPGEICLIKRISGWKSVPAHAAPLPIVLTNGTVWALAARHLERLTDGGFERFEPSREWNGPTSVWVDPSGAPWVVDQTARRVFRSTASGWQVLDTPIARAREIWGRSASDVWLVGDDGAAHFDGTAFRCVAGVRGPLHRVAAFDGALWLAGAAGVYDVKP